jgi:predicted regulator of Ras-like GTPase activity (Roadblock/LC7/MglB family)
MDAAQALADLTEISSQIEAAVLFDESGSVTASTLADDERSSELARRGAELVEAAAAVPRGGGELTQLEAATLEGSVFLVRDGARRILATTGPNPTVGLVFYDLKSCLRGLGEGEGGGEEPKPKRAPRRRKQAERKAKEQDAP